MPKKLDDFGIHYVEGGWPGSNPKDMQFFEMAGRTAFKHTRITAFGSTRRQGITAAADLNLRALIDSGTPAVAIFGKSWDLHVEQVMGNTLAENLAMIRESVAFLKDHDREVIYDAEHFFDGHQANPDYAMDSLAAAVDGGADVIVLCDTNGGTLPHDIEGTILKVRKFLEQNTRHGPVPLGIHAHNDCGLAVANSISAIRSGATMVHGTINGYGERCGNADLTSVIPILYSKLGIPCVSGERLARLKRLSRFVSETANLVPLNNRPFVGKSAFAHKGGIHVSAIMKTPQGLRAHRARNGRQRTAGPGFGPVRQKQRDIQGRRTQCEDGYQRL